MNFSSTSAFFDSKLGQFSPWPNHRGEKRPANPLVSQIVVMEVHDTEQILEIINFFREGITIIFNLQKLKPKERRRSLDLVLGSVSALDGHQERIDENIFLLAPKYVQVSRLEQEQPEWEEIPYSLAS